MMIEKKITENAKRDCDVADELSLVKIAAQKGFLTLEAHEPLEIAVHKMRRGHVKAAIVLNEKGELTGLVSEKEIYKHLMFRSRNSFEQPRIPNYRHFYVRDVMIADPDCLDVTLNPCEALSEMQYYNYRFMPLTINKRAIGIVDMFDLIRVVHQEEVTRKAASLSLFASGRLDQKSSSIKVLARPSSMATA